MGGHNGPLPRYPAEVMDALFEDFREHMSSAYESWAAARQLELQRFGPPSDVEPQMEQLWRGELVQAADACKPSLETEAEPPPVRTLFTVASHFAAPAVGPKPAAVDPPCAPGQNHWTPYREQSDTWSKLGQPKPSRPNQKALEEDSVDETKEVTTDDSERNLAVPYEDEATPTGTPRQFTEAPACSSGDAALTHNAADEATAEGDSKGVQFERQASGGLDQDDEEGQDEEPERRGNSHSMVSDSGDRGTELVDRMLKLNRAEKLKSQKLSRSESQSDTPWYKMAIHEKTEQYVDSVVAVIIMLNLIQMGFSCDYDRDGNAWLVMDVIFASIFLLDLFLKVWLSGPKKFFWSQQTIMNLMDTAIVLAAVIEIVVVLTVKRKGEQPDDDSGSMFSVLRIVRIARLARILRLVRIPVFRDLLMMFDGIVGGARTLFWSMVLLLGTLYAFAIFLRETIGDDLAAEHGRSFRTMAWSMFTIFRCVMGDCSADDGRPIFVMITEEAGAGYALFYMVVIILTNFGLFNVIIAIYVENTVVAAKSKEKMQKKRRLVDTTRLATITAKLVHEFVLVARGPHSGHRKSVAECREVNLEEAHAIQFTPEMFNSAMEKERVQDILLELDIDPEDQVDLFDVLDADGGGLLQIGELISGLHKLRGDPKRSDIIGNGLALRSIQENINKFESTVFEMADHQHADMMKQLKALAASFKKLKAAIAADKRHLHVLKADLLAVFSGEADAKTVLRASSFANDIADDESEVEIDITEI